MTPAHPPATAAQIVESASRAAFDKPLITNVYRSLIVEAMVDAALRPAWRWCSADYAGWDFEHESGARLEVKQSAARQSWKPPSGGRSAPSFDIAERSGYWIDGSDWVAAKGRHAQIYIFAYHPILGDSADHRDPEQWEFSVLGAARLPVTKTIGLPGVRALAVACTIIALANAVETARLEIAS